MNEHKIMRILREANDYSQEYVASKLKINQNTYSKLELGQSKLTIPRVKQLANLYDVPASVFLSEKMPVINYNTGKYSRSIISSDIYDNEVPQSTKLFERLISEKDKQIEYLTKELNYYKKEKEELNEILKELLQKVPSELP